LDDQFTIIFVAPFCIVSESLPVAASTGSVKWHAVPAVCIPVGETNTKAAYAIRKYVSTPSQIWIGLLLQHLWVWSNQEKSFEWAIVRLSCGEYFDMA
jgi:hypothetical protein